ncbi:MAG: RNA methyltransferase [Candidatus Magasanikbacteria bacterium]|uniref:RNA methyltransferase n=1 Tax=Candidatus Magasanikbacteria bacterium CG10_big_fil_rev_8_21_14_0_10_38_6 TaxID=1974647 RepID=A0A2M6P1D9_9BACT|nr:RNA methyltransferase [Candidatus Magasanikbacteria bacterium]NCS71974.1 RNA methyltransferase [Candidatus Magasanikbacteria bacterium]PIR77514.1 MAG: RNA methyltransferase [Candidatus Magasanikbacteria bacterium CG10_big_fil_rev_8_21_14_0_10_38_6]
MTDFYLLLPNIRSCHNVGAMFRTADAFGITKLFLCGYTAVPPKIQIDKVALGAETWIPWEQREDVSSIIRELREQGVSIIALEKNDTSVDISIVSIDGPVALVLGNEVDGVSDDILALCDVVTHIPMQGKKESLNVSIAAGIAMYMLQR